MRFARHSGLSQSCNDRSYEKCCGRRHCHANHAEERQGVHILHHTASFYSSKARQARDTIRSSRINTKQTAPGFKVSVSVTARVERRAPSAGSRAGVRGGATGPEPGG